MHQLLPLSLAAIVVVCGAVSIYIINSADFVIRNVYKSIIMMLTCAVIVLVIAYSAQDQADKATIIGGAAAFFASIGWLYTNINNTSNARKAHTMNILVQYRNSAVFAAHAANASACFPQWGYEIITAKAIKEFDVKKCKDGVPVGSSIIYMLNYFEFICAGIDTDDLDSRLIRNTLRSIIINMYIAFYDFIQDSRKDDNGRENRMIFLHIERFVKRFANEAELESLEQTKRGLLDQRSVTQAGGRSLTPPSPARPASPARSASPNPAA